MTEPSTAALEHPVATGRWRNPYKSLPGIRRTVQAAYVLFFAAVGIEFHSFFRQAVSGGAITANRPPAVEGFLPISALMGLKRLILTGSYDEIHPAGLTILIAAIVSSFLARKVFCSWVCPIGGLSRALEWAGRVTLWKRRKKETVVDVKVDMALSSMKYLLLAFFLWSVVIALDLSSIEGFMNSTYNRAADAKMLLFFTDISRTAAITLVVLAALSFVIKNFWCRYLCPYGALLGLVSWASPQTVVRDPRICTDCKACTRACPVEIKVHGKESVRTPECTGCMSCVSSCPVENCLTVTKRGRESWSPWGIPIVGLVTIILVWGIARATGHWQTGLPLPSLIEAYRQAHTLIHP